MSICRIPLGTLIVDKTISASIVVHCGADVRLRDPGPVPLLSQLPDCDDPRFNLRLPLGGICRPITPTVPYLDHRLAELSRPVFAAASG
jgi:hypothetical protein